MGINKRQVQKGSYVCMTLLSLTLMGSNYAFADLESLTREYEGDKLPKTFPRRIEFDASDLEKDNSPFFSPPPRSGIIGEPPSKPLYGQKEAGSQKLSQTSLELHWELMNSLFKPDHPEVKDSVTNIMRVTEEFKTGAKSKRTLMNRLTESMKEKSSHLRTFFKKLQ